MGKERQFVVNERGEKVAVLIGIEEYGKLLEELEDLEDIRAYDEAMASEETPDPFEEAIERIERERKVNELRASHPATRGKTTFSVELSYIRFH
jgi:hypothetical protein